jgi:hypothetical protein
VIQAAAATALKNKREGKAEPREEKKDVKAGKA